MKDNLIEKEDIITGLEDWQKAKAKSQAYKELSDLVVKYDEKVTRQLNEAISKYNRIKKQGTNQQALYEAMDHILNFSVQQIADVCIPVIFHLEGKFTYEDFKDYLRTNIIGK